MDKLKNKNLDEIGKALVKADVITAREIDAIVANPALFDAVRERIQSTARKPELRRSFVRPVLGAFAALVLATAALALFVFRPSSTEIVVVPPVDTPKTSQPREPNHFTEPDRVIDTRLPRHAPPVSSERIVAKSNPGAPRRKQHAAQQVSYEGDFYALSYAGDPNETERGGRIVRMDVPRSTLFAMGVDIPLENEAETVKADLLIGSDGVTRAIRVVK